MSDTYFETLPPECPPVEAQPVDNVEFYRFVKTNPATDNDFISHRLKYPKRKFNVSECEAHSISLFRVSELLDLSKLPMINGIRATITLTNSDGVVLKTGDNEHHSWWRSTNFTIGNNIAY